MYTEEAVDMARQINEAGRALVKQFEGYRAEAYRCPAGVWTIGYGHTGGVKRGYTVTPEQAEALLASDLSRAGLEVERLVTVPLSDNQFASLCSFDFNLGASTLANSTLLKRLNAGNYAAVPGELAKWVKVRDPRTGRKKTMAGLVKRRAAEAELWVAG